MLFGIIIIWVLTSIGLLMVSTIVPGIKTRSKSDLLLAALILGIINGRHYTGDTGHYWFYIRGMVLVRRGILAADGHYLFHPGDIGHSRISHELPSHI